MKLGTFQSPFHPNPTAIGENKIHFYGTFRRAEFKGCLAQNPSSE